jgi:mannose-6-phosphate isomerase-like protein (cupin superfamily)
MGVRKNDKQYEIGAGDVVNLPRTIAYRIAPAKGRLEYVAVQIFPAERRAQAATGKPRADQPMPDVVPNATIQDTFAKNDRNQPLHTLGAATMNHVIYNGAPGPYEVHLGCDDIYFVRLGSAEAKVDGFLVNAKETSPGELRGTGVYGAREYKIGVGDILCIPRNTFHYMDPGSTKLGYLLLKVWD